MCVCVCVCVPYNTSWELWAPLLLPRLEGKDEQDLVMDAATVVLAYDVATVNFVVRSVGLNAHT